MRQENSVEQATGLELAAIETALWFENIINGWRSPRVVHPLEHNSNRALALATVGGLLLVAGLVAQGSSGNFQLIGNPQETEMVTATLPLPNPVTEKESDLIQLTKYTLINNRRVILGNYSSNLLDVRLSMRAISELSNDPRIAPNLHQQEIPVILLVDNTFQTPAGLSAFNNLLTEEKFSLASLAPMNGENKNPVVTGVSVPDSFKEASQAIQKGGLPDVNVQLSISMSNALARALQVGGNGENYYSLGNGLIPQLPIRAIAVNILPLQRGS